MPHLDTVDIRGVEVLATGTHDASTGRVKITRNILEELIGAYKALKGSLNIPVKLGHADEDDNGLDEGMPAAGWVENLRIATSGKVAKLVVDLMRVPAKVADLMKSGGLRSRSVEIQKKYHVEGKGTFPSVLTGLALLGSDLPAVKGLADIFDLYREAEKAKPAFACFADGAINVERFTGPILFVSVPTHAPPLTEDETWDADEAVAELRRWASDGGSGDPMTMDFKKYSQGFAVVEGDPEDLTSYKFPHHRIVDGVLKTSRAGVIAAFTAASGGRSGERNEDALRHLSPHRASFTDEESDMDAAVLKSLSLKDDASNEDVLAAITALTALTPALRKRLSLEEDADQAAIDAKLDELLKEPEAEPTEAAEKLKAAKAEGLKLSERVEAAEKTAKDANDEVAKLRAERLSEKNEAVIDKAIEEFKVTPAEKEDLMDMLGEKPTADVQKIIDKRVVILDAKARGRVPGDTDLSEFDPTTDEIVMHEKVFGHTFTEADRQSFREHKAGLAGVHIETKTTEKATA